MKKQELMEQELIERTESLGRDLRSDIVRVGLQIPRIRPATNDAAIVNLIDNSDFNWSDIAYTTAGVTPATAGDDNNRAYHWYRIERATALLVEDDAHSLKGSAHSLFAGETADTPRWNKTEGWAELGGTGGTAWDIYCPLPTKFATPGQRFRLQMIFRLRTSTASPGALKFFWSLWDNTNTPPAPEIIKGSAFTLSGNTFGPVGGTARSYKLIVDVDNGTQVESTVLALVNTPAVLTAANGVALTWDRYAGFTRVTVYVTEGGVSSIAGIIGNGANAFNDTGQRLGTVAGVPSITGTVAQAYAETISFEPTLDWLGAVFSIAVPPTYDFSLTTGKQFLRGGVIGAMGDGHQLQIDRIGLSFGDGLWSPSIRDQNAQSDPSTSQTSSTQGPSFSGGDPPNDGEGRVACSTLDTLLDLCDEDGSNERQAELRTVDDEAIKRGVYLVGGAGQPNRVRRQHIEWSSTIVSIRTANGAGRRCSPSDLWLLAAGPETGTPARRLFKGLEVLTRINGSIQPSEIVRYSVRHKREQVRYLELEGTTGTNDDHIFWAGQAGAHNVKIFFTQ